jgi:hypothetical protein
VPQNYRPLDPLKGTKRKYTEDEEMGEGEKKDDAKKD